MSMLIGRNLFASKTYTHNNVNIAWNSIIEMTQCYLVYINPALPTSIMILRYVTQLILV